MKSKKEINGYINTVVVSGFIGGVIGILINMFLIYLNGGCIS